MTEPSNINPNWITIISGLHNQLYLDPHTGIFLFEKNGVYVAPNLDNCEEFISYVNNVFTLVCNMGPDDFCIDNTHAEIQKIYDCAYNFIIPEKYKFVHAQLCGCNMGHCNEVRSYKLNEFVYDMDKQDDLGKKIQTFGHLFQLWGEEKHDTKILNQGFYYYLDYRMDIGFTKMDTSKQLYIISNDHHAKEIKLPFEENKIYILWAYL